MNELYVLVGLAGSGKSFFIRRNLKDTVICSSDVLRAELFGDENDQTHNSEVFIELHRRIIDYLRSGKNVAYDATNLSRKRRVAFLNSIKHINCEKNCIIIATPYDICIERDKQRARTVGEKVIMRQMQQFQTPFMNEGWDAIHIEQVPFDERENLLDLFKSLKGLEHNNPHHLEDVYEHSLGCYRNIVTNIGHGLEHFELMTAGLYHDLGKKFTKVFHNTKGEPTYEAHFYNHQFVSCYLYITSHQPYWNIAWLIENHMRPFFNGYDKWKKTQNQELIRKLELLQEADIDARVTRQ